MQLAAGARDRLAVLRGLEAGADLVGLARAAAAPRRSPPASCSWIASWRATSRGSSDSSARTARFARQRATASAIACARRLVAAERIEQIALRALVEEPLLLVLAVDLDERARRPRRVGRLSRSGRRSGPWTGRRPRPRERRSAAPARGRTAPRRARRRRRGGSGCVSARAPDREAQRVDQQALAGAGLTGQHVEAGRELQPERARSSARSVDRELERGARRVGRPRSSLARSSAVASRRQQLDLVAQQIPERHRPARLDEADRPLQRLDGDHVADRDAARPRGRRC